MEHQCIEALSTSTSITGYDEPTDRQNTLLSQNNTNINTHSLTVLDSQMSMTDADKEEELTITTPTGLEEFCYYTTYAHNQNIIKKFDSAASSCMSGNTERITQAKEIPYNSVQIKGFNSSRSNPTHVGINSDGKKEYYVPSMSENLVLLCAHTYASEGAAILHKDGGIVIKMSEEDTQRFLNDINERYRASLKLKVNNHTYEVDDNPSTNINTNQGTAYHTVILEEGMSNTATRYFNTKVNPSNPTERILTLLLTGLSFNDWYSHVKNGSLKGIPPDVTVKSLNRFEHKYGRTPDIIRLALPMKQKNQHGLMDEPLVLTKPGERVEIDVMEPEFNDINGELLTKDLPNKSTKLPTFGGAIAAAVCVDCYSGYVYGKLLKSKSHSIEYVRHFVLQYQTAGIAITKVASDSGVLTQSTFNTMTPEVEGYLLSLNIKTERAEPHNHSRGTATVERSIRSIKDLMRMAFTYVLRNPNLSEVGMTTEHILKLWGELFFWAITVINFKVCGHKSDKSKYEVFTGTTPNMQTMRLLPIFSFVLVYDEHNKKSTTFGAYSEHSHNRPGIYVGPSLNTPGAIRVALMNNKHMSIKVISKYPAVTDGGGLKIHDLISSHIPQFINDTTPPMEKVQDSPTSIPTAKTPPQHMVWTKKHGLVPARRSQRLIDKELRQQQLYNAEEETKTLQACFADWSTHEQEDMYVSPLDLQYINISDQPADESLYTIEEGYKAVTENVPKSFPEALQHPLWGPAARKELDTLIETKAIMKVDASIARHAINNLHADLLILFPVYEVKLRDGETVYKVRLVGDGRTHYHCGDTYSATPSREELLVLIHIISSFDWDYAHLDEQRAFLTAQHQGTHEAYAKFRADNTYYRILGALYGMKTAPKDYQLHVAQRFEKLGYKRLIMCSCIYTCNSTDGSICVVFAFVDDFIFAGNNKTYLDTKIAEFQQHAKTTIPLWNPETILGFQLIRDRESRTVKCTMSEKINEVCQKLQINLNGKFKGVPMPITGFIIRDDSYEKYSQKAAAFLNPQDTQKYMAIVGSLVWISGIRQDILFSVLYLTWFTKQPRLHHYNMAIKVLTYLGHTKDLPLVLGGQRLPSDHPTLSIYGETDASLGTAPKGRSTTGHMVRLGESSGAILAKSKTTTSVITSSFEAELDGAATALKSVHRIRNILDELHIPIQNNQPTLYSDNQAMIEFIKGNGVAKGVRHMELRMWYLRDKVKRGSTDIKYAKGSTLSADKLTKLGNNVSHFNFTVDIMGLKLLDSTTFELYQKLFTADA